MSILLAIAALGAASFSIAVLGTVTMIRVAPRLGLVDKPGGRKIHTNPTPLGGGIAITAGVCIPLILGFLALLTFVDDSHRLAPYARGAWGQSGLFAGLIGCVIVLLVLGVIDDRRALGPMSKLIVQLAVAAVMVVGFDIRAMTFLDAHVGGAWLSQLLSILWIGAITNAFNFLDNMDGLTAGVSAICATALLVASLTIGQYFVAATLACVVGSVVGFLLFNFPPARIFMGDAGSLVLGFLLGVLSVRTTFLDPGSDFGAGWYAVFAPIMVLALPLYDLIVVSAIRVARGKSPFVGDRNHFSHRLVDRGMSKRTAVLCLWLVTATTSVAAIILPGVASDLAAILLMCQTLLILGLVMLLERHPIAPRAPASTGTPASPHPIG